MILLKNQFTMRKKNNPFVNSSIWLIINVHQKRLSPQLNKKGVNCRFYPSCSNYGIMALEEHGFLKGWMKSVNRVWRCRPGNHDSCVDYP